MPPKRSAPGKTIETITHDEAKRVNIPTSELATVARKEDVKPVRMIFTLGHGCAPCVIE